jgi:hypothetical protein
MRNRSSPIIRVCRLCLQPNDLQQSHIIPEFMYKPLYHRHRMIHIAERAGQLKQQKPMQKGVREPLLCRKCEGHLNTCFEQPNTSLWRALVAQRPVGKIAMNRAMVDGMSLLQFRGFDYQSFKLLLLSVLWRASVAMHEDYAAVNLGPHENAIREMLYGRNPGSWADYPCLVCLPAEPNFGLMAAPVLTEMEGHTAYKFLLPGVVLCFVVTNRARLYWTTPRQDGSLVAPLVPRDEAPFIQSVTRLAAQALRAHRDRMK